MSRKLDAEIAVKQYGWKWENPHGTRNFLVPPENHEMRYWTAKWDEDGIPHFLPKYSEMDNNNKEDIIMNEETRKQLAEFLQKKLHEHCSGYMFSIEDVHDYINDFFKVQDLIIERDKLQKQIDELTKN